MNVKQLKDELEKFDDNSIVVISDDYGWDNIHSVSIDKDTVYLITESGDFTLGAKRIL